VSFPRRLLRAEAIDATETEPSVLPVPAPAVPARLRPLTLPASLLVGARH
jgi:hypothetical protein